MPPIMSRQRSKTNNYHPLNIQMQLTMSRQRFKTRDYCPSNLQMQLTMSRQRSKTRNYHLLNVHMQLTMSRQRSKTRDYCPWGLNLQEPPTMSRQRSKRRNDHLRDWIFRSHQQHQGKDPKWGIITLEMQLTMSRQRSKTWDYHPRGWIFGYSWQCQGKDPREGIITLGTESSEATDNIKAKIQDKELLSWRLNRQMQLTMSRQRSKTRDDHPRGWIFEYNWQCQGKDSRQAIITLRTQSSEPTDKVKVKIQDEGLLSWRFNCQLQLTMSRQRSKTRDYHPRGWIFGRHW